MITDARRPKPKVLMLTSCRVQRMITDARRPRPKLLRLTPSRLQPYDTRSTENQAKGIYADAIQSTAI